MGAGRVEVVEATPQPTAVVVRTTTWEAFPTLWPAMLDEVYGAVRAGAVRQTGHNVMLYLDDRPLVEVGVEVAGPFPTVGNVTASHLPGGPAAMAVHHGAYGRLGEAHRAIHDWSRGEGRPLSRVRWEVYGDWREDEAELETEVWYLLADQTPAS